MNAPVSIWTYMISYKINQKQVIGLDTKKKLDFTNIDTIKDALSYN